MSVLTSLVLSDILLATGENSRSERPYVRIITTTIHACTLLPLRQALLSVTPSEGHPSIATPVHTTSIVSAKHNRLVVTPFAITTSVTAVKKKNNKKKMLR